MPDKTPTLLMSVQFQTVDAQASQGLLEVRFTSTVELFGFAAHRGSGLGFNIWPCRLPRSQAAYNALDPHIHAMTSLADGPGDGASRSRAAYAIRFAAKSADQPAWRYDLTKAPEDMCFFVGGGSGRTIFASNTVVIPADAIVEALRTAAKAP